MWSIACDWKLSFLQTNFPTVDIRLSGDGKCRTLNIASVGILSERLLSVDHAAYCMAYVMDDSATLPWRDHRVEISVTSAAVRRSALVFRATGTATSDVATARKTAEDALQRVLSIAARAILNTANPAASLPSRLSDTSVNQSLASG